MTEPFDAATVVNALMDSSGRGMQEVTVVISLIAPRNPFLANGTGEVLQRTAVDTDHDGTWSALLLANTEFEQAGTYYLVDETRAPGGAKWAIRVPSGGGTYQMRDLLVYVPPGDNPGTGPTVPAGTFEWVQNTPASVWTITHNLGYAPNIELVQGLDPAAPVGGMEYASRSDPNPQTTILTFGGVSTIGRALCS